MAGIPLRIGVGVKECDGSCGMCRGYKGHDDCSNLICSGGDQVAATSCSRDTSLWMEEFKAFDGKISNQATPFNH